MNRLSKSFFAVVAFGAAAASCDAAPVDACAGSRNLKFVNGRIVTMDKKNSIVSSATIQNGVFADAAKPLPCTKVIDLHGRTAVPGLIDNHNHIVLLGLRPGHDARIETANSIASIQELIAAKAKSVPAGEFITSMGGWNPAQFAEKRLPTLAELDAAAPNHPVLLFLGFNGPAATNAKGKAFFASKGIEVSATGQIGANAPSLAALNALRAAQTFDDRKRGTLDAMNYAARMGITTSADMGAFVLPGTPDVQDSFTADTLASADPFHMYDAFLAVHREQKMPMRLRVFFLTMDKENSIPLLTERVLNQFPEFGDDMMRISGIGEFATNWPLFGTVTAPPNYLLALQFIAKHGWAFQQHSLSPAEDQLTVSTFEKVNSETPIANLHWSIAHAPRIDRPLLDRLKAIGAGMAIHPFEYLAGAPGSGPPLRTILDSGIHAGAGSDAAQISTIDPWLMIYYMVTGKNSAGAMINPGQQITRTEALRLYTAENGWFFHEEEKMGSIESGKFGDLVVLSNDYFDPAKVPDEAIRSLQSVLTVVDGRIVYDALSSAQTKGK
jgi:predicted amidohydrolase YtcJ